MKYIIVTKEDNVFKYLPLTVTEHNEFFFKAEGAFYEKKYFAYFEVESIPAEVVPEKYCYTEADGFYLNPDWVDPEENKTEGEN